MGVVGNKYFSRVPLQYAVTNIDIVPVSALSSEKNITTLITFVHCELELLNT